MLALIETVSTLTLTLTLNFILILNQIFVGWKQWLFGPKKNQSFRNKSAKRSRSGPNSVYVVDMSRGDDVQVIFGAIGPFSAKWGWDEYRGAQVFFCGKPDDLSGTSQWPIYTKFGHETHFGVPSRNPERHFRKFSLHFHFPPKSEVENRSNRHLTQSRLQVTGCTAKRYGLLHVVVQGPGSFRGRSISI